MEGEEQLSLRLSEDPFVPAQVTVEFAPNVTAVTITDTDGKYSNGNSTGMLNLSQYHTLLQRYHDTCYPTEAVIGFFDTDYTGLEADGFVTVAFGLISGGVQEPVEVMLSLRNGTAIGKSEHSGASKQRIL